MKFSDRTLRAFLAVAEAGSMGKASERAHLSQSALSRCIAHLEAQVGQKLFDRHSKGVYLTAAGETLAPYARLLLAESQQAEDALDELRGLKRGMLRVGANGVTARLCVIDAIDRVLLENQGTNAELVEDLDDILFTALVKRELDLVVAAHAVPCEGVRCLAQIRKGDVFRVACKKEHPLIYIENVTLSDILRYRWVLPKIGFGPREQFKRRMQELGQPSPHVTIETRQASTIAEIISRTEMISWLPHSLISATGFSASLESIRIPELELPIDISVFARESGVIPPLATILLQHLINIDAES